MCNTVITRTHGEGRPERALRRCPHRNGTERNETEQNGTERINNLVGYPTVRGGWRGLSAASCPGATVCNAGDAPTQLRSSENQS